MAIKTWNWNKFYGGLSDIPTMVSDQDVTKLGHNSYGVDGRKEPNGVQLGNYLTTAEYTVANDIVAYIDLAEFGVAGTNIVACTDTGEIYLNGVLKHTLSGAFSKLLYGMTVLNNAGTQYIYYFSEKFISRSNITLTTFINEHIAINPAEGVPSIVYNFNNFAYISNKNVLKKLDGDGEVLTSMLEIDPKYNIVGFNIYQNFMRVYASNQSSSCLYLYDTASTSVEFSIPYEGLPILGVTGENGEDYAVMGPNQNYTDLYLLSGTSKPQLLCSNYEGDTTNRKFNGKIVSRLGTIWLGGSINGNTCLFSFGNYHKGYPKGLQCEGLTGTVTAIYPRSTDILFGNKVINSYRSGIMYIGKNIGFNQHADIGEVASLIFTGGIRSLKSIQQITIYFDNDSTNTYFPHGGTIYFYARKKGSASRTQVSTFDTTTKTDGFYQIPSSEIRAAAIGSFNQIEYKIRMLATLVNGSYILSPLITEVETVYDDNLKDS